MQLKIATSREGGRGLESTIMKKLNLEYDDFPVENFRLPEKACEGIVQDIDGFQIHVGRVPDVFDGNHNLLAPPALLIARQFDLLDHIGYILGGSGDKTAYLALLTSGGPDLCGEVLHPLHRDRDQLTPLPLF